MRGAPVATVLGSGFRASSPDAALANGTMAHALDYDDVTKSMSGHPSVPLVPAVFALGEELSVSGEKVLEAYIVGFEVEAKVGRAVNPSHYEKGWHATSTLGVLGAAAAGAKLLGLSTEKTRMALGIAASQASGVRLNFGSMTKPFHAGNAARGGVMAAMLAGRGFTADREVLEKPLGFCHVFAESGASSPEKAVENLGDPFEVVSPGVGLKPYPSCRCTHSALDAMIKLVAEKGISPDEVEKVECGVNAITPQVLIHDRPRTALEGKFSMQFCLAVALREGRAGLAQFTDEKVQEDATQELIQKVNMFVHPEFEGPGLGNLPAIVTVHLKNGESVSQRMDSPKGDPDAPLIESEVTEKYRDCAGYVLPPEKVERSLEMLAGLEKLKNVRALMDNLI
jgi:2-methylcitrate dehydratase PrpD